jgi:hypothetical protein
MLTVAVPLAVGTVGIVLIVVAAILLAALAYSLLTRRQPTPARGGRRARTGRRADRAARASRLPGRPAPAARAVSEGP